VADAWPSVVAGTATKAATAVDLAHRHRPLSPRLRSTSTSRGRAAVIGGEVLRGRAGSLPESVPGSRRAATAIRGCTATRVLSERHALDVNEEAEHLTVDLSSPP